MIQNDFDEVQARQVLSEIEDAKEIVVWFRRFHLVTKDAVLLATLQSVVGFGLIAVTDMPWSLLGCGFLVASAFLFSRMKAVLAVFDMEDGGGRE